MKKEAIKFRERIENQEAPGKIIYICFNDWDDEFETEKCAKFLEESYTVKDPPFEYNTGVLDQAVIFTITTTEEDLREYGYEEFLNCQVDPHSNGIWKYAWYPGDEEVFPPYKNPRLKN